MTYRDDNVEEINRLNNQLTEAEDMLLRVRASERHYRGAMHRWMLAAGGMLLLLAFFSIFMAVRAPLSASTRRTAEVFCDALAEQAREEQEARR